MKLNTKDPVMIAKIAVAMSLGIILSYIIVGQIYQNLTRCDTFCRINKMILENTDLNNAIGSRSIANLNPADEEEIKSIVKKSLKEQWIHYNDENSDNLDKLIKELYLPEEYQHSKEEIEYEKESRKQYGAPVEFTSDTLSFYVRNIKFTKFIKYKGLDDRVGVIAGSFNLHYFIFKKIDNQWRIEKERIDDTYHYGLPDIKEILEEQNLTK